MLNETEHQTAEIHGIRRTFYYAIRTGAMFFVIRAGGCKGAPAAAPMPRFRHHYETLFFLPNADNIRYPGIMFSALISAMKRAAAVAAPAIAFPLAVQAIEPPRELHILTWSDYMDPGLIEEFEERYNAKINFAYFESDELRDDMLLNTEGSVYDVICTNGRSIRLYAMRDWLMPISDQDIPNRKYIDERWANAFADAAEYAVPYFWGTVGIAYRADLVQEPVTSWRQLLDPPPDLQGRIVLVKDARDLMAIALKSRGKSVNSTDSNELAAAKAALLAQKPHVLDYSYIAVTDNSALVRGDAVAAMVYNGDALMLAEHNENISFVVPEEGTSIWVDYLVVSRTTTNRQLAMEFINFINEPENAARLAQYVYYATPNQAAAKLLPEDFLADPVIYPDRALLEESEFYLDLPPRTQKQHNSILPQIVGE